MNPDAVLLGPQGVIPLGGCVVTASENAGMPFAIVVNLEDFTVRSRQSEDTKLRRVVEPVRACPAGRRRVGRRVGGGAGPVDGDAAGFRESVSEKLLRVGRRWKLFKWTAEVGTWSKK